MIVSWQTPIPFLGRKADFIPSDTVTASVGVTDALPDIQAAFIQCTCQGTARRMRSRQKPHLRLKSERTAAPILFLLGPSGSGKTTLARWVSEDLRFLHIEVDRWPEGDGIDFAGLRSEWNAFVKFGKAGNLAAVIHKQIFMAQKDGAVLSFPSNLVLPIALFEAAERHGIQLRVLYGTGAECLAAFLQRNAGLDANHWFSITHGHMLSSVVQNTRSTVWQCSSNFVTVAAPTW